MATTVFQKFKYLIKDGRLRSVGTQILIMSSMLLAASLLLLWVNYDHLRNSLDNDKRTSDALQLIDRVEFKLVGVEMTLRGYALTGDPAFKKWGASEWHDLESAMLQLAIAMKREPEQTSRFFEMRDIVQRRLGLYAYLYSPEHTGEVSKAIVDPATRDVMHRARQRLADLRKAQVDILVVRQAKTDYEVRQTLYLTTGIVLLAFVSVVFGIVLAQGGVKPEL